jgi:hypothetical protein
MLPHSLEVLSVPHLFLPDSGHSGGFQWNKNWQRALPILLFLLFLIPAESLHSGIDTGMFPGIHWNRLQPECVYQNSIYLIYNQINMLINNYNID